MWEASVVHRCACPPSLRSCHLRSAKNRPEGLGFLSATLEPLLALSPPSLALRGVPAVVKDRHGHTPEHAGPVEVERVGARNLVDDPLEPPHLPQEKWEAFLSAGWVVTDGKKATGREGDQPVIRNMNNVAPESKPNHM